MKYIVLIFFMYVLVLLQTSFVVAVSFPLVLVATVGIALVEPKGSFGSIIASGAGGLLLDMFSVHMFGFWVLVLLLCVGITKLVVQRYVQLPFFQKV
jgi:hypothetical protein